MGKPVQSVKMSQMQGKPNPVNFEGGKASVRKANGVVMVSDATKKKVAVKYGQV